LFPAHWSVWSLPRSVVAYILLVDVAAVAVAVAVVASTARLTPVTPQALVWCALLIAGLIVHKEASRGIERIREIATEGSPHTELQSIWIFAAWTGGMVLALAADVRHDPAGQPAIAALAGPHSDTRPNNS
jgi:hypothetical protein